PKAAQIKENLIAMKELRLRDDVEYAVPNYIHTAQLSPDDTLFRLQSHYKDIRLPQAWNLTTGSADVTVAVIDSGVFLDHEDLADKLVAGYDFISSTSTSRDGDGIDSDPDDPGESSQTGASSWHGTHVTGTIAAATNNNQGTAGVGWNTKVMPLRVLGLNGAGTSYDVMQAVRYAARLSNDSRTLPAQKADIINLSLGSDFFSEAEQDVFDEARNAGVIVVAAAGNASTDRPFYPASYDGVISVSATAPDDTLAYYSNFGSKIDVAAPGGDLRYDLNQDGQADGVLSTSVNDTTGVRISSYNLQEGTSMATPHVTGVIALMKGVYPALTPGDVDVLLASGSITIDLGTAGRDNSFGHGRIDALKAILAAADLAGGGDLPAIAVLDSDPAELQFGTSASLDLTLTNANSAAENPAVTYEVSDDWIQVDASQADTNGLGSYSISVNRTGLLDGIYEGNIRFIPDSGYNLDVPVTMQVGDIIANRSLAPVYVLLEDADTGEILDEAIASPLGNFSFRNVPNGTYRLQAGSDIDVDLFICQNGETCGEYPDSLTDEVIEVNGSNVSGISFLVSLISSLDSYSASSSANSPGP
ncbi:MAG: S8 family peptidase, partial [Thalassolituus sp.]